MNLIGKIINYKYKIEKKISESEFASVYRAFNRIENDRLVIIKFVKIDRITHRKEDITRFRTEAITVSRIDHPHIIRITDMGEMDGMQYLVMEPVEGITLSSIIDGPQRLSVGETVTIVMELCEALVAIHDQDIVHKQLNPGNIIIPDRLRLSPIKLINFGFAQIKDFTKITETSSIIDTFSYMSPEQGGIIRKKIDNRSDLYSLGILFYRLLTGQLPFKGADISSIMHQHIAMLPEPIADLAPAVPEILERIVLKLIEKEPERRYKSARRLHEDLTKFIAGDTALSLDDAEDTIRLRTVTVLAGRSNEYDRLIRIFDNALNGRGSICLISGEFGIGKSRLIDELISNIYYHRGTFIEGKGLPGQDKVPFGAIRETLNDYLRHFNEYPTDVREMIVKKVRADMGNRGEMIVRFNPLMETIIGEYPHLVELKPDRESARFLLTLAQLFFSLSIVEKGIVLVLDNLEQLDDSSFAFLSEAAKGIRDHPLLIIGMYRDNERTSSPGLEKFIEYVRANRYPIEEIRLEPFDGASMNEFVAGLLYDTGEHTRELSDMILAFSRGNPYFAAELLKQLNEVSAISRHNNRYVIDLDIISSLEISPTIIDIILKRIIQLNDMEKTIISYAAVMGNKFDIEILFRLTKYPDEDVIGVIDKAVIMQIIRPDPAARGVFLFTHDRVRDELYQSIDGEKRKMIHFTIAGIMEDLPAGGDDNNLFGLAHHYIESGNKPKIIEFAYPAGIRAKEDHANDEAIKYLVLVRSILEETGKAGSDIWNDCMEKLGHIYLTIGRCDEAIDIFNTLLKYTNTAMDKAVLYQLISQAYFIKGDWKSCETYGVGGLRLLGERVPTTRVGVMAGLAAEIIAHSLLRITPEPKTTPVNADRLEKYKLIINYYMTLNWMYILSDIVKFIRSVLRMLRLSQSKIGPSPEAGMSIAVYGSLLMTFPFFEAAVRQHNRALAMRRECDDPAGVAQSLQFMGYCYCYQSEYETSIEYFRQSHEIFSKIGDIWETTMVMNGLGYDHFYLAEYEESIRMFRGYLNISETINDDYGVSVATANLCLAYSQQGDFDLAEEYGEKSIKLSSEKKLWYPNCFACINYGFLMMEKNNYEEALVYFKIALSLFRDNNFLRDYTVYLYPLLAESYLEIYKMGKTEVTRAMIRRACAECLHMTRRWSNHYAAALRVTAKFYAMEGKEKKAALYFKKSIQHSAMIGRRFEMALGLYEHGIFLKETGRDEYANSRFLISYQIFKEIGAAAYINKVEGLLGIDADAGSSSIKTLMDKQRMYSIIRVSQDISSILNLDELLEKVMSVAIEVTGAQRGVLMMVDDSTGELETVIERNINPAERMEEGEIIMEIALEVFKTGKSIIVTNAMEDEYYARMPSVAAFGLKSICCIPLKHKDEIRGVCYLDNSLSASVFTDDTQDVLGIIMTQAAISIEIVRLYELGITDGLTKLATHRHFQEMLQKEINKSMRYSRDLSLIMMDIDHFKIFNDRHGHQAGDEILKAVARIILGNCRTVDIAARYGGEELALILPETPCEEATIMAERIRGKIEDHVVDYQHKQLRATISMGIASFPRHAHDRQSLIRAADEALYRSKENGRNRTTVFSGTASTV